MLTRKSFYFIRHGQTDWNKEDKIMGYTDIPLNETGIKQAYNSAPSLKELGITTICHSPLKRAKETAHIINETLQSNLVEIDGLKECGFGKYEGSVQDWDILLPKWKNGFTPDEGEAYIDFVERVKHSLNLSLNNKEKVLIVAHGGVYDVIEHRLKFDQLWLENCIALHIKPCDINEQKWYREILTTSN